jgi:hypothetical protein
MQKRTICEIPTNMSGVKNAVIEELVIASVSFVQLPAMLN